jgi:riboflavin kinase / FMN adenylyltransferase
MADPLPLADDSGLPPNIDGTVVTVGTFDGVHRGHQDVLARLAARATQAGLRALLVTFDPHPLAVVNPAAAPPLLTVGEEKLEVLAESDIHYLAVLPFTPALRQYSPEQFVDLLIERFRMRELLIGHDHGFGRGRAGDVEVLRSIGSRRGFRVDVVAPVTAGDGRPISSTQIRRAVAGGDLQRAWLALGRPYAVGGRVVRGEKRGRLLGYPTLNLAPPSPRKLLPPEGVYAVRVQTPRGAFGGMMNLGPRPTFGDTGVSLEVHLFDAEGEFYGAHVRVEFIARLRDTVKFPSADALIAQLGRDAEQARRALTLHSNGSNVLSSPRHSTSSP